MSRAMLKCGLLKGLAEREDGCSLSFSKPSEGVMLCCVRDRWEPRGLANAIRAGGCHSTCIAMIALSFSPSDG
jgi:hypothetical protein